MKYRINPYDLGQVAKERFKNPHAIIAKLKAENERLTHQNKELIEQLKDRDDFMCQLLTEILKQDMSSPVGHLQEMIKKSIQSQKE